jgi:hypothetical protein
VFYLDSNGPDGEIDINDVDWTTAKLEHSKEMFGLDDETYHGLFGIPQNSPLVPGGQYEYTMY